jgi:hypothetical protein
MNFSDPVARGQKHLAEITGGEWVATGFSVKTRSGQMVANMQRARDAEFIAEAAPIISMLIAQANESRAEAKKIRGERSMDANKILTLEDQLVSARLRCEELQRDLDAAVKALEERTPRRA